MTTPTLSDVANHGNLVIAHANAKRGKTHYKAVKSFEKKQTELLKELEERLFSGTYRTSKYKLKIIQDSGKERLIAKLPYFPDRVAHWAIMLQLEPIFLEQFSPRSHAAIPNRGIHSALYQTREVMLKHPELKYCLKLDIRKYFPHIDHEILKEKVRGLTSDPSLLELLDENIDSYTEGVPIGNYTSQYWANYYLTELDNWLTARGILHIRYMDDIVIFGKTAAELHELRKEIAVFLSERLKLEIKDNWQIFPVKVRGVDFAGYRAYPNRVLVRKSTFKRMRRKLALARRHLDAGQFGQRDQSRIASYVGWLKFCTPKVRVGLFKKYVVPLLEDLPPGYEKFTAKLYKNME